MLGAIRYKRRQPEKSLLYQVVQDNIGPFIRARAREGKDLPRYVIKEFEEYLRCGRLEHGLVNRAEVASLRASLTRSLARIFAR
jgi:hypothetical protein